MGAFILFQPLDIRGQHTELEQNVQDEHTTSPHAKKRAQTNIHKQTQYKTTHKNTTNKHQPSKPETTQNTQLKHTQSNITQTGGCVGFRFCLFFCVCVFSACSSWMVWFKFDVLVPGCPKVNSNEFPPHQKHTQTNTTPHKREQSQESAHTNNHKQKQYKATHKKTTNKQKTSTQQPNTNNQYTQPNCTQTVAVLVCCCCCFVGVFFVCSSCVLCSKIDSLVSDFLKVNRN